MLLLRNSIKHYILTRTPHYMRRMYYSTHNSNNMASFKVSEMNKNHVIINQNLKKIMHVHTVGNISKSLWPTGFTE